MVLGAKFVVRQGIHCRPSLGPGYNIWSTGKLHSALLAKDHAIKGVCCKADTWVRFFETGELLLATLANSMTVQGAVLKAGTDIQLHRNGTIMIANLTADQTVQGLEVKAGKIEFHATGALFRATLSRNDQPIQVKKSYSDWPEKKVLCRRGEEVRLFPNGYLQKAVLATAQKIVNVNLPAGTQVELHEEGWVKQLVLSGDFDVHGARPGRYFPAGTTVVLGKCAVIEAAKLSVPFAIKGTTYQPGCWLHFNESGDVTRVHRPQIEIKTIES
jgi:hypothetical protein